MTPSELADYLQRQRAAIDRALEQFLKVYGGQTQAILKAMRYGLFPGGKRIRPLLILLTAKLAGYTGARLYPLSAMVEFMHTATLLHDDVIDQRFHDRAEGARGIRA